MNKHSVERVLGCLGPDLSAYHVKFQKNLLSEGARAVSVYFSNPGQTVEILDSVGVDLDYTRPDLSVCEVRNQKKLKTLAGQFFQWGVIQFSTEKSNLGQSMRNLASVLVDLVRGRPNL